MNWTATTAIVQAVLYIYTKIKAISKVIVAAMSEHGLRFTSSALARSKIVYVNLIDNLLCIMKTRQGQSFQLTLMLSLRI